MNSDSALAATLVAIEAGATRIDGSLAFPGMGHVPSDALCATCHRLGLETGVDAYRLSDVGEDLVRPLLYALGGGDDQGHGGTGGHDLEELRRDERRGGPHRFFGSPFAYNL